MSLWLFAYVEKKKLECRQMRVNQEQTYCNSVNKGELLICSPIWCSYTNSFSKAFTVPILKFLNWHIVAFMQYQKKYCKSSKFKQT